MPQTSHQFLPKKYILTCKYISSEDQSRPVQTTQPSPALPRPYTAPCTHTVHLHVQFTPAHTTHHLYHLPHTNPIPNSIPDQFWLKQKRTDPFYALKFSTGGSEEELPTPYLTYSTSTLLFNENLGLNCYISEAQFHLKFIFKKKHATFPHV